MANLSVGVEIEERERGERYDGQVNFDGHRFSYGLVFGVPLGKLNDYAGGRMGDFWEKVDVEAWNDRSQKVDLNDSA